MAAVRDILEVTDQIRTWLVESRDALAEDSREHPWQSDWNCVIDWLNEATDLIKRLDVHMTLPPK